MNDRMIIPEKELNYIETLYLNCDLHDFAKHDDHAPNFAYFNMLSWLSDTLLSNAECLGEAKGRTWYKLPNYRLGIMEYDKAKIANQPNCVIQYEQKHLFDLDHDLTGLDLPFDGDLSLYKIKRIDITKIAKLSEDYTTDYGYISPYRTQNRVDSTVYLGSRKGGNVFRMYNKTKELLTDTPEHPINHEKINLMSEYFGDIENLFTFELELKRVYLKETLGIDNLSQLDLVYKAYRNIVGQIRFYRDSDRNKRFLRQGNRDRIPSRRLTEFIEYRRVKKKDYRPSFDYLIERIKRQSDHYMDSMGLEKSDENYMKIINALISERVDTSGKDMVISYEDTADSLGREAMAEKHERLRAVGNPTLETEARRAFGKVRATERS